jgi:RimJ/RimL family protein N-acetyltransferase
MKFQGDHRTGPETARLRLRAFEETDAEAFYRLNSHPEVMRYTGEPPCESVEAARRGILEHRDWPDYGIGRWATVHKPTGQVIGFAGFKYLPEFQALDLGYRFLPEFWGKGLATEATVACLAFGFDVLELDRLVAFTLADNAGSIRVLEKVGFLRQPAIMYDGEPAEYFILEAVRYRAHSGAPHADD